MAKTINFCGDSFCASESGESWTKILPEMLNHKILGFGKGGSAHEHAIQSFDSSADITIFCWTEPHRLYHPHYALNSASAEEHKKQNNVYAGAFAYYKFVHDFAYAERRQKRELYWFDHKVLSQYSGKIIHCWSFKKNYEFTSGITFDTPLVDIGKETTLNHMTPEQNYTFANQIHNLLKEI